MSILIEIGVPKGRCGWRDTENITLLLNAIKQYPSLSLCGIGFYEGVIHGKTAEDKINRFISHICSLLSNLHKENSFDNFHNKIYGI